MTAPLTDSVILALARLVDDAQSDTRQPSHSDLEFQISRAQLTKGDPKAQGQLVGKAKRVRGVLYWALENSPAQGARFVEYLLGFLRSCGSFRPDSPNYSGRQEIENAVSAFRSEGFSLSAGGDLQPLVLENLTGLERSVALRSYVRRAQRSPDDAALLTGTGKDLLEATAAHILTERTGTYSTSANFETLLGMTYVSLGLATPQHPVNPGESPLRKVERNMFSLALSINAMRNKLGTGHGRPWLPDVTVSEGRAAVQFTATIAEWLLECHAKSNP